MLSVNLKSVLYLAIFGLLVGCTANENDPYIKEATELKITLNKIDSALNTYSPADILYLKDTVGFDVKFIQQEYEDTMSLLLASKVDVYYRTIRSIEKFEKAYGEQRKDVDYSMKQIDNMISDLNSGVLDSVTYNMYAPAEKEAVTRLAESNVNLKAWYESINSTFNKQKGTVDSLIRAIKIKEGY